MGRWDRNTNPARDDIAYFDYRIGRASTTLLKLRDLSVNAPDQVIYRPFAESYLRADNTRVGDGVASISWIWDVISIIELSTVLNLFFDNLTDTFAENRFIRSDKRLGDFPSPQEGFFNFDVTVWRPEIFGPEGTPITRSAKAIQSVQITFTNLVEV